MTEQPAAESASPEQRLAALFGGGSPEVAKPESEAQVEEQPQVEQQAHEAQNDDEPEAPEGETVDIDGEEYVLPPKLKAKWEELQSGTLRQSDYTRKTQELAELHKQALAFAEAAQTTQAFERDVANERDELARVKHQIGLFKNVNWSDLDVQQHLTLRSQLEQLKERAGELDSTIKGKEQQFSQWKDSKRKEVIANGQKYLQQTIKGWNQDTAKEVAAAAKEIGYSQDEIENIIDARFVRMAWKAAQFDKLQSLKTEAVEKAQKAPPVVRPGASKGPGVASEQKYRDLRATVKKSGNVKDVARLLALKGF